jgi:hypothetical protein
VLSNQSALNANSGALIVSGGVGIGKNLYVKDEIISNDIIIKGCGKIEKNLFINGEITVGEMFFVDKKDKKNIIFKKKIIPMGDIGYSIGIKEKRWDGIYGFNVDTIKLKSKNILTENIDACGDISLGTNGINEPIVKIDNTNGIIFNDNIYVRHGTANEMNNGLPIFELSPSEKIINFDGHINTSNLSIKNFISIKPQFFSVLSTKTETMTIIISSSLVFLEIGELIDKCVIKLSGENIQKFAVIRFILKIDKSLGLLGPFRKIDLTVIISDYEIVKFCVINEYMEILWDGVKFIYIGGDIEIL